MNVDSKTGGWGGGRIKAGGYIDAHRWRLAARWMQYERDVRGVEWMRGRGRGEVEGSQGWRSGGVER